MTDERQAGGKYGEGLEGRIPPNQAVTRKFPVMTAGKTPDIDTAACVNGGAKVGHSAA